METQGGAALAYEIALKSERVQKMGLGEQHEESCLETEKDVFLSACLWQQGSEACIR